MQAHQQRVVDEKAELDEKLNKLNSFFSSDIFSKLDKAEQGRMERQAGTMQTYSDVLGERINAFN